MELVELILPIVLLIVGLAFVVAEVFFVSMGLLSVMAGLCILAADVLAFQKSQVAGWILVAVEVVFVPLLVVLAFRVLPKLPFGRRMLLTGPVTEPGGGFPSLAHLVGQPGVALTDLRPSGMARFGEERVSVVAVGRAIARDAEVIAVAVEGAEVKVRAARPQGEEDEDA